MAQKTAYYFVTYSCAGCLADSDFGVFACEKRADLVAMVNSALQFYGFSDRARRQVNLRFIWQVIQKYGTGRASFRIDSTAPGDLYGIEFHNLTAAEFRSVMAETESCD